MKLQPLLVTTVLVLSACSGGSGDSGRDSFDDMEQAVDANSNVITETDANETDFALADTSWQSECTVEGASPGTSQIVVWRFTATEYFTGPNLYDNIGCQGAPRSVGVSGRYELTGNVTTTTNGLTVHEFEQYIGVQQFELLAQTIWLHMDGDALYVATTTDLGVEIDQATPVFFRQ